MAFSDDNMRYIFLLGLTCPIPCIDFTIRTHGPCNDLPGETMYSLIDLFNVVS